MSGRRCRLGTSSQIEKSGRPAVPEPNLERPGVFAGLQSSVTLQDRGQHGLVGTSLVQVQTLSNAERARDQGQDRIPRPLRSAERRGWRRYWAKDGVAESAGWSRGLFHSPPAERMAAGAVKGAGSCVDKAEKNPTLAGPEFRFRILTSGGDWNGQDQALGSRAR